MLNRNVELENNSTAVQMFRSLQEEADSLWPVSQDRNNTRMEREKERDDLGTGLFLMWHTALNLLRFSGGQRRHSSNTNPPAEQGRERQFKL
ncbi:hypothetical protein R3I93_000610 [Phoxinus phoxinus]|uniref:Uncharacterized protein n=1 Tax=Phoxinus phoxinus TaxID=58324 RepID=A0AAN9DLG4_9TELE